MSWTGGRPDAYGGEHDATVLLPVVPVDAPAGSEATVLLPIIGYRPEPPTEPLPTGRPSTAGQQAAAEPAEEPEQSVVRNSAIMAVGSLVSRVTGLLRTVAIGAAIGASVVSDDYNLSNTLPNMVYELLLGGVLASVVVPVLVRARTRDADRGEAYAQRLLTLAGVFLAGATVLAVLAAPLLTQLFTHGTKPAPSAADIHLITTLNYLILPEIFFYGIAALLAAILNTRGHFAAPTFTPILNNLVVIVTAVAFILLPHAGGALSPATITTTQVLVLGIGTTLGIVIQTIGLLPALRKVGFRWKLRFDWGKLHLGELGRISAWMLVYVAVSQVGLVILLALSKAAGSRLLADGTHAPGPAIFNNAYLIFMMVHGIVAVSIMTALMPRMSAAAAQGRFTDLADQFSMGTRLSAVILIPATAAYLTLGQPLAVTIFQWRSYTHDEAMRTGTVIAVAALGLVPFAISQMQLFAFYAMPDTRTPALINIPVVAVRILADLLFYVALPTVLVNAGLMMGNTISFMLAVVLGYALLHRRIGRLGLSRTMGALGRLAAAAAIAAVPTWLTAFALSHFMGTGKAASAITLVLGGLVLTGVYVGAAIALKARDVTDVAAMVRGRFGR